MTQRQINAVAMRQVKTSYKHLSLPENRLVHAMEQMERNDFDLRALERSLIVKFGADWRRCEEAKLQTRAQGDYYHTYFIILEEDLKLAEKVSRLEDKYNLDRDEVMKQHREINSRRFYGGSF